MKRKFICVTSGISAPTVAWKRRLAWEALAYAEIDPFACAVLAQRHGAGRPRHMPDPAEEGLDEKEARKRAAATRALDRIEWGEAKPNWGDFTRLRDEDWIGDADVLVGGTPCQAFSLAGLRRSLADKRGNLTLEFIRLADAIDDLRRASGRHPRRHPLGECPRRPQHRRQRLRRLLGRIGRECIPHRSFKGGGMD